MLEIKNIKVSKGKTKISKGDSAMEAKHNDLRTEALEACSFRGHRMSDWRNHDFFGKEVQICHCKDCMARVVVNFQPLPNEIDIGGEAVALYCPV